MTSFPVLKLALRSNPFPFILLAGDSFYVVFPLLFCVTQRKSPALVTESMAVIMSLPLSPLGLERASPLYLPFLLSRSLNVRSEPVRSSSLSPFYYGPSSKRLRGFRHRYMGFSGPCQRPCSKQSSFGVGTRPVPFSFFFFIFFYGSDVPFLPLLMLSNLRYLSSVRDGSLASIGYTIQYQ